MRKIILVSPIEPSGATWLINCFLELGILTYRVSPDSMWNKENGFYVIKQKEQHLKKWLPALTDHDRFEFRGDVQIQWMHDWPRTKYLNNDAIFFVRDPRDALYSRYKRENPKQSFQDFIEFPDTSTLLDKVDNWCLFNRAWMSHPRVRVIRFEDYKNDAIRTLSTALDIIGQNFGYEEINRAIERSAYQRAVECERKYREQNPGDREIINRCGQVAEWKGLEDRAWLSTIVERRCGNLLDIYGYERVGADAGYDNSLPLGLPNIHTLSFFHDVIKPEVSNIKAQQEDIERNIRRVAALANALAERSVTIDGLTEIINYNKAILLVDRIEEFLKANEKAVRPYLAMDFQLLLDRLRRIKPSRNIIQQFVRKVQRILWSTK